MKHGGITSSHMIKTQKYKKMGGHIYLEACKKTVPWDCYHGKPLERQGLELALVGNCKTKSVVENFQGTVAMLCLTFQVDFMGLFI